MATAVVDGAIDQNTQLSPSIFPSSPPPELGTKIASPLQTNGAADLPMVPQVNVNGSQYGVHGPQERSILLRTPTKRRGGQIFG